MTEEGREYSPVMMSEDFSLMTMKKMKKINHHNKNNQRRFSDEQIKSLETMFESETRLEPRKKVQLARELGLQPRQVAIWFQNKRARWKSKQLETEFNILRQNYNNLASQFESLTKEKQNLNSELEKLKEMMQKPQEEEEERECCDVDEAAVTQSSTDHETENPKCEPEEVRPEMDIHEKVHHHEVMCDHNHHHCDDDDYDENIKREEYFGGFVEEEADHIMNIVEPADSCLTSSDDWRGFKSDTSLLDQSSNNYPWWDFWS